jgi:mRNA-degrading endonuclease RelE of RelBE toxin-antitoxin system
MEFRIADSFTAALGKLSRDEQKAVKTSVFDLQTNPEHPGLKWHRIGDSKDPNFWSCRVSRDIRIVVHKTAQSFLLAYVGHHDDAYTWAGRRRIEAHPKTGAIQVVEVRERVEEVAPARPIQQQLDLGDGIDMLPLGAPKKGEPALCFGALDAAKLMSIGVPADWINDVLAATEDNFLDIATHLPAEAGEALLEFISTGVLDVPAPVTVADPFQHPDALRRFRVVENLAELEQALSFPWEKWIVFLHPSQRELVEREFDGPVRVTGSAGTGKTVVALHRAARLADRSPTARVLLTTFSDPLAVALERRLKILVGETAAVIPRIRVASFLGIARELYELIHARPAAIAGADLVKGLLIKAAAAAGGSVADGPPIAERFLLSEWTNAVDAWQASSADAYAAVPRLGRKSRMGNKQRDRLWPIFEIVQRQIAQRGLVTEAGVFRAVAEHYRARSAKPFDNIVVDEAQDLGVPELCFLAAIAPPKPDALFFTGDLGQRIFQQPFSWRALGVDVQGRSVTLSVNYRTSHQIRETADRLMPGPISDADGEKDDRSGTISVFNGPEPIVVLADDADAERGAVAAFLRDALDEGVQPEEIAVFVRTREVMARAREAVKEAGCTPFELTLLKEGPPGEIRVGVMHLAKGLEFKAVAVIGCDEDQLPLRSRIEAVADEVELDDVYATERHLFYVASTRARDRLLVSGVRPGSEFLGDLKAQ